MSLPLGDVVLLCLQHNWKSPTHLSPQQHPVLPAKYKFGKGWAAGRGSGLRTWTKSGFGHPGEP